MIMVDDKISWIIGLASRPAADHVTTAPGFRLRPSLRVESWLFRTGTTYRSIDFEVNVKG